MKQKINKTTQPIRSQSDRDALASYFWNRNLRDYAFFYFGIYTGRRISDIVRMNVRDVAVIDKKSHFVIRERLEIQEKKTGKFTDLILHPTLRRALSKYLKRRLKKSESKGALLNEPLFKSQKARRNGEYRITERQAGRILNLAAYHCGLNQLGASIERIQKLLNHSSPEITLAYIGITRDDLDEVILSLP